MSIYYAILGMLTHKDMTGYEIKTAFDSTIKCLWPSHLSQIYRELGKLESKESVSSYIEQQDIRPDKKVYSITESGKEEFLEWLHSTPKNKNTVIKDEVGLRMFFGNQVSGRELKFQLQSFIKDKRETLTYLDSVVKNIEDGPFTDEKMYWLFSVRKSIKTISAEVEWAEECIHELEHM
ncbi:PadR family transcriptional regulator [Bacillus sp. 31A1R]|uniref:PadR family transcriptional regulator n=1 Tax=Robertmurraya mangrovi TaxID=3098077 RepID=A0ABU5J0H3_9BACI|nr:PadR family transcriptional regulator [Bacillus sp. 31A1R]MDZ5472902.1 PadR family transcriptional regulator [Bacillus sp. 31A1R]